MALSGSAKLILGIALAITLGVIFLQPVLSVTDTSTGTQTVTNESVTVVHDQFVDLGGWDIVDGSYTVTDQSGTAYTEGSDYELDQGSGELKALSSGTISDGETVLVSYDYEATGGLTETVVGFVPIMFAVLFIVVASRGIQEKM